MLDRMLFAPLLAVMTLAACGTAAEHQRSLGSTQEREMTLGTAQREIKPGMSQADVATALGSPNIVTKDGEGRETWVYDKIASEASYSQSSAGTGLILALVGGGQKSSAAASTTQRTLTIVLKFDKDSKVESMQYHASKF